MVIIVQHIRHPPGTLINIASSILNMMDYFIDV